VRRRQVLDPGVTLALTGDLANRRVGLQKALREQQRKVVSTIHFRLAYTLCALVIVLMGASLGVMFRGARALAAFALSLIPFFSVMVLMVLGASWRRTRTRRRRAPGHLGGLVLAGVADGVMLRVGVRR